MHLPKFLPESFWSFNPSPPHQWSLVHPEISLLYAKAWRSLRDFSTPSASFTYFSLGFTSVSQDTIAINYTLLTWSYWPHVYFCQLSPLRSWVADREMKKADLRCVQQLTRVSSAPASFCDCDYPTGQSGPSKSHQPPSWDGNERSTRTSQRTGRRKGRNVYCEMVGEGLFLPEEKQFITSTQHILENIEQLLNA